MCCCCSSEVRRCGRRIQPNLLTVILPAMLISSRIVWLLQRLRADARRDDLSMRLESVHLEVPAGLCLLSTLALEVLPEGHESLYWTSSSRPLLPFCTDFSALDNSNLQDSWDSDHVWVHSDSCTVVHRLTFLSIDICSQTVNRDNLTHSS